MRYQNPATFTRGGLGDSSTPSSFFWKVDKGDLARADVLVLVYWRGGVEHYCREIPCCKEGVACPAHGRRRQSVGTWAEFGLAIMRGIPIIVVTDDPDVRDHPAIQQEAAIVVETVEEAWGWLEKLLVSDAA